MQNLGMKPKGAFYRGKPGDAVTGADQDLPKHYLLCEDCEKRMSQGERLLEMLANSGPDQVRQAGIEIQRFDAFGWHLSGDALVPIQRALLGTLVRIHHAPSMRGRLTQKNELDLADRVNRDDYSRILPPFGVRLYSFIAPTGHTTPPNPKAIPPTGVSRQLSELILGGIAWHIPNSIHFRDGPDGFFTKRGWKLLAGHFWDDPLVGGYLGAQPAIDLELPALWAAVPADQPCPCGSGETKARCCALTWLS